MRKNSNQIACDIYEYLIFEKDKDDAEIMQYFFEYFGYDDTSTEAEEFMRFCAKKMGVNYEQN